MAAARAADSGAGECGEHLAAVDVDTLVYRYSYSFDGETWHAVPVTYEAWKLSDDYIGGRGFFTGAFVGLHCEDISGDGCYADFDYFTYEPA